MKKIALLLGTVILAAVMTGCVKADYHVTVHKDGSADYTTYIGIEDSLYKMAEEDPFKDNKKDLIAQGYTVKKAKRDGTTGFEATKKLEGINELSIYDGEEGVSANEEPPFKVETKKGFFSTTYKVTGVLDFSQESEDDAEVTESSTNTEEDGGVSHSINMGGTEPEEGDWLMNGVDGEGTEPEGNDFSGFEDGEFSEDAVEWDSEDQSDTLHFSTSESTEEGEGMEGMENMMNQQMNGEMTFRITLPSSPEDHNADSYDGKTHTLTWDADMQGKTDIQLEYKVVNTGMIAIICGGVIALVVVLLVVLVVGNRNRTYR